MTKAEMIDMLEKIRNVANMCECKLCPCDPLMCRDAAEASPCNWSDYEIKRFVDRAFYMLEISKEK